MWWFLLHKFFFGASSNFKNTVIRRMHSHKADVEVFGGEAAYYAIDTNYKKALKSKNINHQGFYKLRQVFLLYLMQFVLGTFYNTNAENSCNQWRSTNTLCYGVRHRYTPYGSNMQGVLFPFETSIPILIIYFLPFSNLSYYYSYLIVTWKTINVFNLFNRIFIISMRLAVWQADIKIHVMVHQPSLILLIITKTWAGILANENISTTPILYKCGGD